MYVIRLLHEAVFMKAGSYSRSPWSLSLARICSNAVARMDPFSMGISYDLPVLLSVTIKLSDMRPVCHVCGGYTHPRVLGCLACSREDADHRSTGRPRAPRGNRVEPRWAAHRAFRHPPHAKGRGAGRAATTDARPVEILHGAVQSDATCTPHCAPRRLRRARDHRSQSGRVELRRIRWHDARGDPRAASWLASLARRSRGGRNPRRRGKASGPRHRTSR